MPRARVVTVAAIIIAARRRVSDSSTWENSFRFVQIMARYALRKRVLSTDYTDFSKRGSCICVIWGRLRVPVHRRIESSMMTIAATMMITVRLVLMRPWTEVSGFCASGQKMSVIDLKPATSVVVLTNASGMIVTHAYLARPELMIMVVATHKATAASN